jgi:hypothetical protein
VGCDVTRVTYYDHWKADVDYKSQFRIQEALPRIFGIPISVVTIQHFEKKKVSEENLISIR